MKMLAISAVTVREMLRRKIQVSLLLFGVVLVIAAYFLSLLTLGDMRRIILDFGLTAIELIATLLAIFLGSAVVAGDVERRVVYPIAAKPIGRTTYVVGRYLGVCAVLVLNVLAMALTLAAVLVFQSRSGRSVDATFATAAAFICVQVVVVAAVAVLFSCVTTSTLAAIFSFSVTLAGHLTNEMRALWRGGATWVGDLVWYLLPNLGALSLNDAVLYRTAPTAHALTSAAYAVLYAATALALGTLAFERRDLN